MNGFIKGKGQPDDILLDYYARLKNIIRKYYSFPIFSLKHREDYTILLANKQFQNKHKGERCFILGNGPSIKTENLSSLKNEHVFVVNQAAKNDYYYDISPEYHVCIDPVFFNLNMDDAGEKSVYDSFIDLGKNKSPICFFPVEYRKYIQKAGLDKKLTVHYLKMGCMFHEKYKGIVDLTKILPTMGTVVQEAILIAIYMGFTKIYLLGCDTTGLIVSIKGMLNVEILDDYSYNVNDIEKNRIHKMIEKNTLEAQCKSYLYTLRSFRWIYDYCCRSNIQLINCSSQTVITDIPKQKLTDVVRDSNG